MEGSVRTYGEHDDDKVLFLDVHLADSFGVVEDLTWKMAASTCQSQDSRKSARSRVGGREEERKQVGRTRVDELADGLAESSDLLLHGGNLEKGRSVRAWRDACEL